MQGKEAHPSRCMDGILMRMISSFGDMIGNVVNGDDPVSKG